VKDSSFSEHIHTFPLQDAAPVLKADWRTFRAKLVAQEHLSEPGPSAQPPSFSDNGSEQRTVQIQGREWAHPIQEPEKGCLLLASTELDGDHYFDRAVILVLDHSEEVRRPNTHHFAFRSFRKLDSLLLEWFGYHHWLYHNRKQCGGPDDLYESCGAGFAGGVPG
jgi:hypothetical protein